MRMTKKPKIAVIGAKGFPAWGGAARANEAIFTRLKDRYDVTVYALSSHACDRNYNGIQQKIIMTCKNKKISVLIYYIKALFYLLLGNQYNVIHVNHASSGFLLPFLRLRFKTVLNVRGGIEYNYDNKWKWHEKKIFCLFNWLGFRYADRIITVQRGSVPILRTYNKNVKYIPNGVENNKSKLPDKMSTHYDITFSAARIIYLKGLHLLLDALQYLEFDGKVQIIGDLDQVTEYKAMILQLAVGLDCEFTGLIKGEMELYTKISQSKLFVFPSFSEGMSNMLLEVASMQIPILASDIEQNKEVFNDGEMLYFKCGNYIDLAKQISYAMDNHNVLKKIAKKSYNKVLQYHNWDNIANEYTKVYEELL